jgi:uncharacterized protein YbjT (DUF2867 family)
MTSANKVALVLGATGLVGGELVRQLLTNPNYREVISLARCKLELRHDKLRSEILDFDKPDPALLRGDDLFCALGTTIKKAGSQAQQYKIDCGYPFTLGKIAKENGVGQYLLVSSIGANPTSKNFYLRTKGELEQKLATLGFRALVIARPSILLGNRAEKRTGEKLAMSVVKAMGPLMLGGLRNYRGIEASQVARALIALANQDLSGTQVFSSNQLMQLG